MLNELVVATFLITGYAPGKDPVTKRSCGATGLTRAQTTPVAEITVAADPKVLPLGSRIEIEGLVGERHVHDTGGDIKGHRLDLYFKTCKEAKDWGRRHRRVRVTHVPRRQK